MKPRIAEVVCPMCSRLTSQAVRVDERGRVASGQKCWRRGGRLDAAVVPPAVPAEVAL